MMFDDVSFSPSVRTRIRDLQTDTHHPEARLFLAILERAVHDLDHGGPVTRSRGMQPPAVEVEERSFRRSRFPFQHQTKENQEMRNPMWFVKEKVNKVMRQLARSVRAGEEGLDSLLTRRAETCVISGP
jgi:hypothetical protein